MSTVTPEEEGAQKATPNWWFEVVPEGEDGTRLDRFLRRLIPGLPQGDFERMLRSGLVRLDGAKAKPSDQKTGRQNCGYGPKRPGRKGKPCARTLR